MNTALIVGVVASSILSGTSLLYATLGELVGERAGIVNLGLEGILLIGAATGFAVSVLTGNPYIGLIAAAVARGRGQSDLCLSGCRTPGQSARRWPLPDVFSGWA
jgi:ABC-type uncharacterized transport system permease subunit